MDEILTEFTVESKRLLSDMASALEVLEEDPTQVEQFEFFGNYVDRMMGGAKSIAMGYAEDHAIHLIAKFCELCKAIGYKAAQTKNNQMLSQVVTALLLDATETLENMVSGLNENSSQIEDVITSTFLDRLNWVLKHFDPNLRGSVAINSQADIDRMLKSLGMG